MRWFLRPPIGLDKAPAWIRYLQKVHLQVLTVRRRVRERASIYHEHEFETDEQIVLRILAEGALAGADGMEWRLNQGFKATTVMTWTRQTIGAKRLPPEATTALRPYEVQFKISGPWLQRP